MEAIYQISKGNGLASVSLFLFPYSTGIGLYEVASPVSYE